jgi:hypothetical protein
MKRRSLTLMLLLVVATFAAKANPVDLRIAREVALKFVNANVKSPLLGTEELQLVTTYSIDRGDVAFYVFNTPNGFVIVSADDCAMPILGYSNEGQFDTENVPIQLQDYLQDFVIQIQYGIENHSEANEATARQWALVQTSGHLIEQKATTVVEPLITSNWGQGCYYNRYCPIDDNGQCGHAVVGCVATAYAQIMRYWGYPSIGTGSHTYTPPRYPAQTAHFGFTQYDWTHMPDMLSDTSTFAEIDAVATLMWHCGVAANMEYGPSASGANTIYAVSALVNYFGYSEDLSYVYRRNYGDEEWLAMMKDCLNLGRPIYYSGRGSMGGHAFVCDGYDTDDLLHFNWGWEGSHNGYFALDALNPGSYVFNSSNEAVINIHPKCVSDSTYQVTASVNSSGGGSVYGMGCYDCNTVCTLTAVPDEGYTFCSWTENGMLVSAEPMYSFNAVEDRSLVANFAEEGSVCNIVFDLYDAYEYGWNGNCLVVDYGNGVTEQFTKLEGGSSVSFSRAVTSGSLVTLSWIYGPWTFVCSFDISYDNGIPIYHGNDLPSDFQYEFTVDCDAAYATHFISVIAEPEEGGSVTGGGYYENGDTCTLTATANTGYTFVNWVKDGEVVSNDETFDIIVTEDASFVALFHRVQTQSLTPGTNWISTNVEITLDDLKAALEATGGTNIVIKSKNSSATWNGHRWMGTLNEFDVNQMYMITVQAACEITLEGVPVVPAEHPVTISNGVNWIGFPLNESMSLTEAFAGFPAVLDVVKSKTASATWNGHSWAGQLDTLAPGQGFIYKSTVSGDKTFTYPTSSK